MFQFKLIYTYGLINTERYINKKFLVIGQMLEDKSLREMYKKLKVNGSLITTFILPLPKQFLIGLRPKLYLSVRYQSKSLAQHEQKRFISRWALSLGDSRFRFDKFFKPQSSY